MGMDLRGPSGQLHLTVHQWREILMVARRFGWEPRGTVPPVMPGWPADERGGYLSNDLNLVEEEDAAAIAEALDRALTMTVDVAAMIGKLFGLETHPITDTAELRKLAYECCRFRFSTLERLEEFIRYCRSGSFCIA